MGIDIRAELRRFSKNALGSAQKTLRLTGIESLAAALIEPIGFEMSRAGNRFIGGLQVIASGIAPVAAIPTTTATLALWNGEDSGGKAIAIEQLGFFLGSGTPAAGATLFACVSPKKIATAPTSMASGYGLQNASGSTKASKALFATAVTIPGSPAWFQVCSTQQLAAANVGQGDNVVTFDGKLIVPPGYAAGFAILSGVGTSPLYGISTVHSEIDADLE